MMPVINPITNRPYSRRIVVTLNLLPRALDHIRTNYGDVPITRVEEGTFTVGIYFDPKGDH